MISIARTFGAPVSVPAGNVGAERVDRREPVAQLAVDLAHDVQHVRVALDDHQLA